MIFPFSVASLIRNYIEKRVVNNAIKLIGIKVKNPDSSYKSRTWQPFDI